MVLKQAKEAAEEFRTRMIFFLTAALGAVSALFWQTAITDTIKAFIPVSGAWTYEVGVAFIVTLFSVMIIYTVSKLKPSPK